MRSVVVVRTAIAAVLLVAFIGTVFCATDGPAQPGRAGYALVFHDSVVVKKDFHGFPTKQLTFEAWISTTDFCHSGAIMSYALKTTPEMNVSEITQAANHFVIFDVKNVIGCHDFEFIDIIPDFFHNSCHGHYNKTELEFDPKTGSLVDREGKWRHLAVTWNADRDGETIVYIDGSRAGYMKTNRRNQIEPGGAFMLGGEQDCYGGCTDPTQGYYGLMDEVRIWNIARSQADILSTMRMTGDLPGKENLVAYWRFDDPGQVDFEQYGIVADSSGRGNDLDLLTPPTLSKVQIKKDEGSLNTGALTFKNNYAMNPKFRNMPDEDITIEFWARSGAIIQHPTANEQHAEFLSFAAIRPGNGRTDDDHGRADLNLIDDAIRIERYLMEYNETQYLKNAKTNTLGSVSVHINSNRQGNGKLFDNWIDFATNWTDDAWHHLAMTWEKSSGRIHLYFDGKDVPPFWRASEGAITDEDPSNGGVENVLSKGSIRSPFGSLVIGQNQECYGGCFSSATAFDGSMANLRIWGRVLGQEEIKNNMFSEHPRSSSRLDMNFVFSEDKIKNQVERGRRIRDVKGGKFLQLGSTAPRFQISTAPLSDADGGPAESAKPGYMGYALELSDKQLLMLRNFHSFPSVAITAEFWMWSIDGCREGVPFSYAHGEYQANDNAFLIFNYNNWGISVMEEEGLADDHNAGFGSTDGTWHHIAVTWESSTGTAIFYDNGVEQWRVYRAKGKKIPPGGTLVIGREQDCLGGCFDSAPGAAGDVQKVSSLEYGPQDFYGLIEEVRIWKRARSALEISQGMRYDKDNGSGKKNDIISASDPDLVAWWKFDEGKGYTVKDETGHGHTLRILSEPKWVVARWVENCGNSLLEATEGCDDGNRIDGDGCSAECEIEPGYRCSMTSPSTCFASGKSSGGARHQSPSSKKDPKDRDSETPSARSSSGVALQNTETGAEEMVEEAKKGKKRSSGVATFFLVLLVFCIFGFLGFVIYKKRETIYEYAPGMRTVVHNTQDRLNAALGRPYRGYDLATVDPEEAAYVSPGFVDSQPPTASRATGANVPYEPIADETSRATH